MVWGLSNFPFAAAKYKKKTDFFYPRFRQEGQSLLSNALTCLKHLRELDISGSKLTAHEISAVLRSISARTLMETLVLDDCIGVHDQVLNVIHPVPPPYSSCFVDEYYHSLLKSSAASAMLVFLFEVLHSTFHGATILQTMLPEWGETLETLRIQGCKRVTSAAASAIAQCKKVCTSVFSTRCRSLQRLFCLESSYSTIKTFDPPNSLCGWT